MKYPGERSDGTKKQGDLKAEVLELEPSEEELTRCIQALSRKLHPYVRSLKIQVSKTKKDTVGQLCIQIGGKLDRTLTILLRALAGNLKDEEIAALQQYPMENFRSQEDAMRLLAFIAKYLPVWSSRKKADIATSSPSQLSLLPGWETFTKIWPVVLELVRKIPDAQIKEKSVTLMQALEEHAYYSEVTLEDWEKAKVYLRTKLAGTTVDKSELSVGCYNALVLLLERCKLEKLLDENITIIIQDSKKRGGGHYYDAETGLCDILENSIGYREIYSPTAIMARFLPLTKPSVCIARFDLRFPEKIYTDDEKKAWWANYEALTLLDAPQETSLIDYFFQCDRVIGTKVLRVLQDNRKKTAGSAILADVSSTFYQEVGDWEKVPNPDDEWVVIPATAP